MNQAREIYQKHLDRVSRALWFEDYDTVMDNLHVPNRMITLDAEMYLETRESLRSAVEEFRCHLVTMGAKDYHRICHEAAFDPGNSRRITGRHSTYVLRGGRYVIEPYQSEMVLEHREMTWKGVQLASSVMNKSFSIVSARYLRERRQDESGTP